MSCNLLNTRPVDLRGSDTLSDISESGTGTSVSGRTSGWDSREELRDLVTVLGLTDVEDLYQDRFRVDRRKLEHMLLGDNEAPEPADTFFHKIMEETNTFITWPSKLKIGARSKKDPHVRIAGRPDSVRLAKEKIMTVLDTRNNRVTMKLDVSYTDHSHIIGKGGLCIKRVMEETQCHIHFPDSNRSNPSEKSNQVSIAGEVDGVERARSRVRKLTPLIFSFELPILSPSQPAPDCNSPYVLHVQDLYNVHVMFRTRPKLHATLVLVKGVEWEVELVKQATLMLIDYMCDSLANQILIQMSMEISPQHHPIVLGKSSANLRAIMQRTNTKIMFPDANDPNIPSIKKSNITITGTIHNVYNARQQLMGSLPLVLMFDLPKQTTGLPIDPENVAKIMSSLDVFISIRHKPKQNALSVIIKGIERSASNVYEARSRLLSISEPRIVADIPSTYLIPKVAALPELVIPSPQPISPINSPLLSPVWPYNFPHFNPSPFMGVVPQHYMCNIMHGSMGSSGYHSSFGFSNSSSSLDPNQESSVYSSISSVSSGITSPISSPRNPSTSPQNVSNDNSDAMAKKYCNKNLSAIMPDMNGSEQRILSYDKSQEVKPNLHSEYEQKRLAGIRAMQTKPAPGAYRVPTSVWSGYGLCHTSPSALALDKAKENGSTKVEDDNIWKSPTQKLHISPYPVSDFNTPSTSTASMNTSNYLDHTPSAVVHRITTNKWPDLASLLTSLGLEKYIGLFISHEVDLATFPSLTDKDLVEIGVTAFGARRKMLLVISELNKRSSPFSGSAAPGAERKSSSSTLSNNSSPRSGW